jgi:hypothetical protein
MRDLIILWIFMVFFLTLVGRELFAYRGRFDPPDDEDFFPIAKDYRKGKPMAVHYEDFGSALSAVFFIFYNEEWHVSMYWFARVHKASSIIFHVCSIILG